MTKPQKASEVPVKPQFDTSPLPYVSLKPLGDGKYVVVAAILHNGALVEHEVMSCPLTAEFAARHLKKTVGQLIFKPAVKGQF